MVASMLAAGYILGTDSVSQARDFDGNYLLLVLFFVNYFLIYSIEKHMISLQIKVGAEQVKAKANELDQALRIFIIIFFSLLSTLSCTPLNFYSARTLALLLSKSIY